MSPRVPNVNNDKDAITSEGVVETLPSISSRSIDIAESRRSVSNNDLCSVRRSVADSAQSGLDNRRIHNESATPKQPPTTSQRRLYEEAVHVDLETTLRGRYDELEELRQKGLARHLRKSLSKRHIANGSQRTAGGSLCAGNNVSTSRHDGGKPQNNSSGSGGGMTEIDFFYQTQREQKGEWKRQQNETRQFLHSYRGHNESLMLHGGRSCCNNHNNNNTTETFSHPSLHPVEEATKLMEWENKNYDSGEYRRASSKEAQATPLPDSPVGKLDKHLNSTYDEHEHVDQCVSSPLSREPPYDQYKDVNDMWNTTDDGITHQEEEIHEQKPRGAEETFIRSDSAVGKVVALDAFQENEQSLHKEQGCSEVEAVFNCLSKHETLTSTEQVTRTDTEKETHWEAKAVCATALSNYRHELLAAVVGEETSLDLETTGAKCMNNTMHLKEEASLFSALKRGTMFESVAESTTVHGNESHLMDEKSNGAMSDKEEAIFDKVATGSKDDQEMVHFDRVLTLFQNLNVEACNDVGTTTTVFLQEANETSKFSAPSEESPYAPVGSEEVKHAFRDLELRSAGEDKGLIMTKDDTLTEPTAECEACSKVNDDTIPETNDSKVMVESAWSNDEPLIKVLTLFQNLNVEACNDDVGTTTIVLQEAVEKSKFSAPAEESPHAPAGSEEVKHAFRDLERRRAGEDEGPIKTKDDTLAEPTAECEACSKVNDNTIPETNASKVIVESAWSNDEPLFKADANEGTFLQMDQQTQSIAIAEACLRVEDEACVTTKEAHLLTNESEAHWMAQKQAIIVKSKCKTLSHLKIEDALVTEADGLDADVATSACCFGGRTRTGDEEERMEENEASVQLKNDGVFLKADEKNCSLVQEESCMFAMTEAWALAEKAFHFIPEEEAQSKEDLRLTTKKENVSTATNERTSLSDQDAMSKNVASIITEVEVEANAEKAIKLKTEKGKRQTDRKAFIPKNKEQDAEKYQEATTLFNESPFVAMNTAVVVDSTLTKQKKSSVAKLVKKVPRSSAELLTATSPSLSGNNRSKVPTNIQHARSSSCSPRVILRNQGRRSYPFSPEHAKKYKKNGSLISSHSFGNSPCRLEEADNKKTVPLYGNGRAVGSSPKSPHRRTDIPEDKVRCSMRWQPNLHVTRKGCERCLFFASDDEKMAFEKNRHSPRITMTRGGCSRRCYYFSRKSTEHCVYLCQKCFHDTHMLKLW